MEPINLSEIKIKAEFRDLIPPLSEGELAGLEENIIANGCEHPIKLWNGYIVDGHNRYSICQKHGISFKTEKLLKETESQVFLWIIDNQLDRRNISIYSRGLLTLRKKEELAEESEKRMKAGVSIDPGANSPQGRTLDILAKESGVGSNSLKRISKIEKFASKEDKKALETGNKSINDVYTRVRMIEAKVQTEEKLNSLENIQTKAAQGVYDVLTIDPPWKIEGPFRSASSAGYRPMQYSTMSVEEIKELKIPCADDCHVFLWTTQKFLRAAFDVLDAWELEYVCTFVWAKNGGPQVLGLPQYDAEFFLYARKGKPKFIDTKNFFTVLNAKRQGHSAKPEEFYDMIRRVTAGRRLDMFNRRKIEGFDSWGNEAR